MVSRLQTEGDAKAFQNGAAHRFDFNKGVADEGYELQYLMDKTGIAIEQARALVGLFG